MKKVDLRNVLYVILHKHQFHSDVQYKWYFRDWYVGCSVLNSSKKGSKVVTLVIDATIVVIW